MQIYAFGHRKQVGKDTFVKFVMEIIRKKQSKLNVQRIGFADKLKATTHLLYAWAGHKDPSYYEHNVNSKEDILLPLGKSVRQVWIEFANHCREYDPYIWLNATLKAATCDLLFITDLRFPNEVLGVKDNGGIIIKIDNPKVPVTPDAADSPLLDFTGWDEIIYNDGDLHGLYKQAERWADQCLQNLPMF